MDLSEVVIFDNTARHPWELARLEVVKEQVNSLVSKANAHETVTILDIGCGDTYVVAELAKAFPQADFCGIDINFTDDQLDVLSKKYKGTNLTICRDWDQLDLPPKSVDIVLLLDVIEHIEDEIGFLSSLSDNAYLRKNTTYLITVPAYQSLFAAHDVILGHFRRYTNKTLRDRLRKAGLETRMERYFFASLIPPRFIQLLAEKIKPRDVEEGSDVANWKGSQTSSNVIKSILLIDYRIGSFFKSLGIKLPGLSNMVLCQRLPS